MYIYLMYIDFIIMIINDKESIPYLKVIARGAKNYTPEWSFDACTRLLTGFVNGISYAVDR